MSRKLALLIGSQTYGLQGVAHDLDLMTRVLDRHGFTIIVCGGSTATRAGITHAWRELTTAACRDDTVLVYYSGHGGRAPNPAWEPGSPVPRYRQLIVPVDMPDARAGDFRGIFDVELSWLLRDLTRRCADVTVLLDCCHAARMVRSSRARARALPEVWRRGSEEHLAMLARTGRLPEENPSVVRLSAAAISQSAYEDPGDELGGYFTEALVEALSMAVESPISWADLGRWVREQVLIMEPRQRPELAGPADRLVFASTEKRSRSAASVFFYDEDGELPSLRGGHLHGIAVGNRYAVLELGGAKRVATAEVTEVLGAISRVSLGGGEPRDGAPLRPLRELFPERMVALADNIPKSLVDRIAALRALTVVAGDVRNPMARVTLARQGLIVRDAAGRALSEPTTDLGTVLSHLGRMARAATLRELEENTLEAPFALAWGTVTGEGIQKEPPLLRGGDRLFVRVTNQSRETIYVNVYDIGVSYRINLLNDSARSGYELAAGESWCFGHRPGVGLVGVPLSWPAKVPDDGPRLESLVVFVSDRPVDLTVLESGTDSHRSGHLLSGLEREIAARCLGGNRSTGTAEVDVRCAIRHIEFELAPHDRN